MSVRDAVQARSCRRVCLRVRPRVQASESHDLGYVLVDESVPETGCARVCSDAAHRTSLGHAATPPRRGTARIPTRTPETHSHRPSMCGADIGCSVGLRPGCQLQVPQRLATPDAHRPRPSAPLSEPKPRPRQVPTPGTPAYASEVSADEQIRHVSCKAVACTDVEQHAVWPIGGCRVACLVLVSDHLSKGCCMSCLVLTSIIPFICLCVLFRPDDGDVWSSRRPSSSPSRDQPQASPVFQNFPPAPTKPPPVPPAKPPPGLMEGGLAAGFAANLGKAEGGRGKPKQVRLYPLSFCMCAAVWHRVGWPRAWWWGARSGLMIRWCCGTVPRRYPRPN